jgi:hypothetical protein
MLVRDNTGARTWDTSPRTSISLSNGLLYVSQTPGVHREVETLLSRLLF